MSRSPMPGDSGPPAVLPGPNVSAVALEFALGCFAWILAFRAQMALFEASEYVQGVNFVFVPAGVRVLVAMACGLPGALGMVLGGLFTAGWVWDDGVPVAHVLLSAVWTGIGPWLAWRTFRRLMRLDARLAALRPTHLPPLALLVAAFNALGQQLLVRAFGVRPVDGFWAEVFAMGLGDLLGIMLLLALVGAGAAIWRKRDLARRGV